MKVDISCSAANDSTAPHIRGNQFKPSRPLLATAMIGAALIGFQIHKTPAARQRLESLARFARTMGDLSDNDAELVAKLLARTYISTYSTGKHHA